MLPSLLLLLAGGQGHLAQAQGATATARPPSACGVTEATCNNGQCIDRSRVCDGRRDCSDGSDEARCRADNLCEPNEYQCDNKKCCLKTWRCDGDDDCGDGSDEANCEPAPPGSACRYYEWQCASGDQCVPKSFHCDGERDCQDNSDEAGCRPPEIVVSPPPTINVDQSFTFIINCTAVGVPPPQVVWRLNWGHVPEKCSMTSTLLEENRAFGELTCPMASEADQGAYSCEAINSQGSCFAGSAGCGQPGQDAILVVNTGPSPCRPGTFNNEASEAGDCLQCWCSGRTDVCQSADLKLTIAPPPQGVFQLVEVSSRPREAPRPIDANDFLKSLSTGQRLEVSSRSELGVSGIPYFSLPPSHTGNLLKSYGLNLLFTTSYSGIGLEVDSPLVIMRGGGRSLAYQHPESLLPGLSNQVSVRFWPGLWRGSEGVASREELLLVMRNVEQLLIRAQHLSEGRVDVTVEQIQLETGRAGGQGANVPWVEQCACPQGHTGLSCEICAPGYSMEGGTCRPRQEECPRGMYRGRGGGCEMCPCPLTNPSNQFATSCFLDQDNQVTCQCPAGYAGRRCGECARGYQGNPATPGGSCSPAGVQCSPSGSLSLSPDPTTGRCSCRDGWTGPYCEDNYGQLQPGGGSCEADQFLSTEPELPGCINCFCSGVPTGNRPTPCRPSHLNRDQIRAVFQDSALGFTLVDSSLERTIDADQLEVNATTQELSYARFRDFGDDLYYWRLPTQFVGDRLASYGGNLRFTLRFVPRPGQEDPGDGEALVELLGNDIRLAHFSEPESRGQSGQRFSVGMHEALWKRVDRPGEPANREHMLMALAGLEYIIVKAAHSERTSEASIADVSLDTGVEYESGQDKASAVEECVCPLGYLGLSCQSCAPGYTRSGSGLYLGTCVPCDCNGKSTTCDPDTGLCLGCRDHTMGRNCEQCLPGFTRDSSWINLDPNAEAGGCVPINGGGAGGVTSCDSRGTLSGSLPPNCRCKENVEGRSCNNCKPGTFGLDPDEEQGCLKCYCSGVTDECSDARLFWSTLRVPIEASHGFQLTDKRRQQDRTNAVQLSRRDGGRSTVLSYRYSQRDTMVYYWSLPRQFLGNKLGAYGGNLTFFQSFTARSERGLALRDSDVIMIGNGVTLYYTEPQAERMPGVEDRLVAFLSAKSSGWSTDPSTSYPPSREQFLRLLSNIETILVRATVVRDMEEAILKKVTMDIAVGQASGGPLAQGAEECRCPPGYRGLSCEQCATGHYRDLRDRSMGPLGRCLPCPCSGNEESCRQAISGVGVDCICRPGWVGQDCSQRGTGGGGRPPPILVTVSEPMIQIVELGNTVRFDCSAQPGPEAQGEQLSIQWAKQSGLLPEGRASQDGAGLLIITQVQEADSGTYVCTATAGQFVVEKRKELVVGGGVYNGGGGGYGGATLIVTPEDLVVGLGDLIQISCRGNGQVVWSRQGSPLPATASQANGILTISNADLSHSGLYVCRSGGESRQARVTVQGFRAPPQVIVQPEQQTIGQGEDLVLTCSASGDPRPSVIWTKVGEEISASPRISVEGTSLRIRGAAVADRGMFLCTATSAGGSARGSGIVEVEPREAPRLEVYPEAEQTISVGGSVLFQCRAVAGIPSPEISWTRQGGGRLTSNAEVLSGGVLRITRVTGTEAGSYVCTATNTAGRATILTTLTIQKPPTVRLQPSGSLQIVIGRPLRLECLVEGEPRPSIVWRKIGQQGPREVSRGNALFEVRSVGRSDEGTYACLASSPAGEVEERVQVLVLEEQEQEEVADNGGGSWNQGGGSWSGGFPGGQVTPWTLPPPTGPTWQDGQDQGQSREFVAARGGDMVLRADVVGNVGGINIVWKRQDGRPIPSRHVQRDSVLYIRGATWEDAGYYVCEGVDSRGTSVFQFVANLVIAEALQIKLEPQQQTVRPGDSPSITCQVVAGGPANIVWSRQDSQQMPRAVSQQGPVLQFRSIAVSDAGRYVCQAENRAGFSATATATVVVNENGLNSVGGEESQSLTFQGGATVDLPCRLPESPDLVWERVGGELPSQHQIIRNALRIFRVRVEDSGRYQCSSRGRRQWVNLTVVERVTANPNKPEILIRPNASGYRVGSRMEVVCEVEGLGGRGRQIQWSRIGGNLPDGIVADKGTLRSESLPADGGGLYRCTIETRTSMWYKDFFLNLGGP